MRNAVLKRCERSFTLRISLTQASPSAVANPREIENCWQFMQILATQLLAQSRIPQKTKKDLLGHWYHALKITCVIITSP